VRRFQKSSQTAKVLMNSNAEGRGGRRENQNWVVDCPENLRKERRFLKIAVQGRPQPCGVNKQEPQAGGTPAPRLHSGGGTHVLIQFFKDLITKAAPGRPEMIMHKSTRGNKVLLLKWQHSDSSVAARQMADRASGEEPSQNADQAGPDLPIFGPDLALASLNPGAGGAKSLHPNHRK
jgi:hypothetical protein